MGESPLFFYVSLKCDVRTAMFNLEKIRMAAERVAQSHQLEIVGLEYLGPAKRPVLRIYIEKTADERARLAEESLSAESAATDGADPSALDQLAWITHEDCESFSCDFGTLIEVEETDPDHEYLLEVSSPGLDRKLRGIEDYRRFQGSLIKVETIRPVAGNRHWRGRLTDVREDQIRIETDASRKTVKAHGKKRKNAVGGGQSAALEVDLSNIGKANLIPEI